MGALLIAELLSQHVCVVPCHGFGFSGDCFETSVFSFFRICMGRPSF